MAKVTPLPTEFGGDLNELKTLIDERTTAIAEISDQISTLNKEGDGYQAEVKILQDEILIKTDLKQRPNKEKKVEMVDGKAIATVRTNKDGEPKKLEQIEVSVTPPVEVKPE